jgi:hypothetical protein
MPQTPDRFPGEREDEGVLLEPGASVPIVDGEIRYVTGVGFRFYEEGLERGLDLTSGGITEAEHRTIRQLIHFIDEGPAEGFATGAYRETLPSADPLPTSIIWWTSSAKTAKIVEETITYTGSYLVDTDSWKMYALDGTTVIATVDDTVSYSGVFETSRTRAITVTPSGASYVTDSTHPALRQLIHFIDEGPAEGFSTGAYRETLPSADPFPTSIIWWESIAMTSKIVERAITYNGSMLVDTETWKVYDTDGTTVLSTVVDTYTYSGVFETSRTRTIS